MFLAYQLDVLGVITFCEFASAVRVFKITNVTPVYDMLCTNVMIYAVQPLL